MDAFGRNDPDALPALYAERFTLYSPIAWGVTGQDPLRSFVQQFHQGFPGLRLALLDQFASADSARVALRFGMRYHNTGTFFGHPPTGAHGTHGEFHSLRLVDGRIAEQVVTDVSYGIPRYELTVWHREYPQDTRTQPPDWTRAVRTEPGDLAAFRRGFLPDGGRGSDASSPCRQSPSCCISTE